MSNPARAEQKKRECLSQFHRAASADFEEALTCAQDTSDLIRENTDIKPNYEMFECWLSEDGMCGAAISTDTHELSGVFSLNGRGAALMMHITQEYDFLHLNCYPGFLVDFYASFGFEVTGQDRNWDGEDKPDIVIMQYHKSDNLPG